jgi:hypothetical protein
VYQKTKSKVAVPKTEVLEQPQIAKKNRPTGGLSIPKTKAKKAGRNRSLAADKTACLSCVFQHVLIIPHAAH